MENNVFEEKYTKYIEPVYGGKRVIEEDDIMMPVYLEDHDYAIDIGDRVDLTKHEVYSVDPEGCEDADDAFSIYSNYNNTRLYLEIHIADPTEYISLKSDLWKNIVERATTKYPSNRRPIHMIPDRILSLTSLMGDNEIKKAITVVTEIDKHTYEPIGDVQLLFSKILVKTENAYSYKVASECIDEVDAFNLGLKISKRMQENRGRNTKGVKLNELSPGYVKYNEEGVAYLYRDTEEEKHMKQMIAEFAIFANSFVGEYLKRTLNLGIFRTCEAKDWLSKADENITGEEMIQQIITNGITADYLSKVSSHDLVGMPEYCHFTSPIRRLADCVCHYLLKYIYFKNKRMEMDRVMPFTETELHVLSEKCLTVTKRDKKNQYLDIKFRLLQAIGNMIYETGEVLLEYYITGYSGLFLNVLICKINDYNVHMSYTLRVRDYCKEIDPEKHDRIICRKVNCFEKYDGGCIPELDNRLL